MKANGLGNDPLIERTLIEVQNSVSDRFTAALKEKDVVEDVIGETEKIINDLPAIKDFVSPCFPPQYNIFEFYKSEYLEKIEKSVLPFIPTSESKAANDPGILVVLASWLDSYEILLDKLGIGQQEDQLLSLKLVYGEV